jgi:hypothetical protein
MEEMYEIIKAVNRIKSPIDTLTSKIDDLCKYPSLVAYKKNVYEQTAADLVGISVRELQRMRKKGEITYVMHHRRISCLVSDINQYLNSHTHQSREASG